MGAVVEAVDVRKSFGGVHALRGVSLRLAEGELVGLIGPNGSGKTTFLNCVSGVLPPTAGGVRLDGVSLAGGPPPPGAPRRGVPPVPNNRPLRPAGGGPGG